MHRTLVVVLIFVASIAVGGLIAVLSPPARFPGQRLLTEVNHSVGPASTAQPRQSDSVEGSP